MIPILLVGAAYLLSKTMKEQKIDNTKIDIKYDEGGSVGGEVVGKTFRDNYNRTFEVMGENAGILTLEDVDTGKILRKKKIEVLSDFKEIKELDVVDKARIITEHLPKGGELKGVTEIDVSENGEEVSYGTKTRKTRITVKGISAEEIKQEIKFEKQVLERSKRDAANYNEDEIRSAKGMTRQEKEDAIKMHKQSLINNEQVEKIVIPFYEKHLEIAEQSLKETPKESSFGEGGKLGKVKFKIDKEDEDRTEISINGIGKVILAQTFPEHEFIQDIEESNLDLEETLEKIGVDEGDFIGKIEHLEIKDEYKGKGYAKLLMKKAIEVAKKNGLMPIYLNASPMGNKGLNLDDLTSFYESFGFKVFLHQGNNNLMILK